MRIPGHRTPIRGFVGSRRGSGRRNCNVFGPRLLGRPPKTTPQTAECPLRDAPAAYRTPPDPPPARLGPRSGPRREWQHCPSPARKRPVRGTVGGQQPQCSHAAQHHALRGAEVVRCLRQAEVEARQRRVHLQGVGLRNQFTGILIFPSFFIQSHADFGRVNRICISLCVVYIRLCGIRSLAVRHGTKPNIHKGLLTISA